MKKFETAAEEKAFKLGAFYLKLYFAYCIDHMMDVSSNDITLSSNILRLLSDFMVKKRNSLPTKDGNMTFEEFCEKFNFKGEE